MAFLCFRITPSKKMRYYIKCKLNPTQRQRLREGIESRSLAKDKIFYEGMQAALREGTIDENDIVHFVEICYCLEGGLDISIAVYIKSFNICIICYEYCLMIKTV